MVNANRLAPTPSISQKKSVIRYLTHGPLQNVKSAWTIGISNPWKNKILFLLQNFQPSCGAPPCLLFTSLCQLMSRVWNCRNLKQINRLHIVPSLRMSGTQHLFPLYIFMAWAWATVPFVNKMLHHRPIASLLCMLLAWNIWLTRRGALCVGCRWGRPPEPHNATDPDTVPAEALLSPSCHHDGNPTNHPTPTKG